jgi:hypothetical protein
MNSYVSVCDNDFFSYFDPFLKKREMNLANFFLAILSHTSSFDVTHS